MHLSLTVWLIIVVGFVVLICVPAVLDAFFDIDVNSVTDKPLVRDIFGVFWLYMACLALRDVIASKGLSVDALFGFAFCAGVVIYSFWPRRDKDEIRREIEDEVKRQIRKELEEIRNAAETKEWS